MRDTLKGIPFGSCLFFSVVFLLFVTTILVAPNRVGAGPGTQATQAPAGAFLDVDGSKLYYEECGSGPEAEYAKLE